MNFPNLISKTSQKIDRVSHKIKEGYFLVHVQVTRKEKNIIFY